MDTENAQVGSCQITDEVLPSNISTTSCVSHRCATDNVKAQKDGESKVKHPIKIEYDDNSDIWRPPNWENTLNNIRIMRSNRDAPVDMMGCDKCSDDYETPQVKRYHTLISLMLSSQTSDHITYSAMQRLKQYGLNIDSMITIDEQYLGKLIHPVGFWRKKAAYIKKVSQILKETYNYDIPNTIQSLCKLPGVGPKMAHICMNVAWNTVTGIGVDTHVHRISNRINWVKKPTTTPEETRRALEEWLPFELWSEVNHLFVGFGQTICAAVKPKCSQCLNQNICPFSLNGGQSPKKEKKTPQKESKTKNKTIKNRNSQKNKVNHLDNDESHTSVKIEYDNGVASDFFNSSNSNTSTETRVLRSNQNNAVKTEVNCIKNKRLKKS